MAEAPPTLVDQEWTKVRDCLRTVSSLTELATTLDNPQDAEPIVGLAMSQLVDATFWLGRIMRDTADTPLDGIES